MAIEVWFPTLIYDEALKPPEQVRQGMIDFVDKFYEKHKEERIGSANITGDVTGDYQIAKDPAFHWLNNEVFKHCKLYLKEFGVNFQNLKLFSSKCWPVVCGHTVDESDAQFAVESHNHPNSHLSVVFYLQIERDQGGELELHAPSTHPLWFVPLAPHCDELPYPSLTEVSYAPAPNHVVIFPSSLTHCVRPYFGSTKRYSITYDLLITGRQDINMDNEMCIVHPNNWVDMDE